MWTEKPIERIAHSALKEQLGDSDGDTWFGFYTSARKSVVEQILPNIRAILPNMTDHGPVHVARVLEDAGKLLQIESAPGPLSGMELYSFDSCYSFSRCRQYLQP